MQITRFVEGSVWMVGMRWAVRSAGLVSTIILARLLTPEDFGIVAMATLVSGFLWMCADMGASQLLLRTGETDRGAYDTAWTIGLIQALVLSLLLFLAAHPAALYFKEPRLVPVIQVVAAVGVLNGLSNVGIVMLRRDLNFRRDFLYGFCAKVLTVVPTVVLALVYRSYWALVAGQALGQLFEVALSYAMHPFRPRLSLAGWRRFLSFSLWITPSNIANFLSTKSDIFVVGYLANTAQLGAYNVASELSRMATQEVVVPLQRALYPNYAKLRHSLPDLSTAFLIVVRTVAIIAFAFGFGIAAVAEDVVLVVLGDRWRFAVPIVAWLGICGAFSALFFILSGHILVVLERERTMFLLTWSKLVLLLIGVLIAARIGSVVDIAMAVTLAIGSATLGLACYLPGILAVPRFRILKEIVPILLIAVAMLLVVQTLHRPDLAPRIVRLGMDVAVGASFFVSLLLLWWLASGRPDGPERRLSAMAAAFLRRKRVSTG